jgi:hypothetical protein
MKNLNNLNIMTLEGEAEKWVFETNGHKWSNNDDTAGDNYGSFVAGANSKWVHEQRIKSQIEMLNMLRHEIRDYDHVRSVIDEITDTIKQLEYEIKTDIKKV